MAIEGWPNALDWGDFRGLDGRPADATTDAHIKGAWANPPGRQLQPLRGDDGWRLTNVNLVVSLNRSQTWVVRGKESDYLLNHEQGHWNILGLITRELHAAIEGLRAPSPRELARQLTALNERMEAKAARVDRRYDDDTNHSLEHEEQARWDRLIRDCMHSEDPLPE